MFNYAESLNLGQVFDPTVIKVPGMPVK